MSEQVLSHHLATRRGLQVPGASHAIALLVSGVLLWTAQEAPLPALGGAAAFLLLAVEQDVRRMRIPNWLTAPALVGALGYAGFVGGLSGLGAALLGAAAGFAVLFVPFALRWLGAGDVKGCMVLGGFWGTANFLGAFWWMLVVGGVLAVGLLAAQGGFGDLLRRWLASAHLSSVRRRPIYVDADASAPARAGLPFAVAMGLGAAAFQLWGMPW